MGFYLNKVVIMSNNKEVYGKSYKELKDQLTNINEEFGKEMMKEHFKNYLEYVSNGSKDTAGEVMESFRDKRNRPNEEEENMTNDALDTYDDDDSNGDVIASLESYDVTGKGRFLAFIQEKFENSSWDRKGASEDSKKLKDLADFLGYKYVEHRDLKKEEIKDVLKRAAEETDKETVGSCLICAISSHGDEHDIILTKCMSWVPLVDFVEPFSDTKCESLRGKPKVFIVQACRGRKEEKDGNYYTPSKMNNGINFRDTVFAFSTIPDHVSVRNETTGSH